MEVRQIHHNRSLNHIAAWNHAINNSTHVANQFEVLIPSAIASDYDVLLALIVCALMYSTLEAL